MILSVPDPKIKFFIPVTVKTNYNKKIEIEKT